MEENIVITIVLEMLGAPKEHVEETMKKVIDKMKEAATVREFKEFPPEKVPDKPFFSSFTEAEIEFKDIERVVGFCFDFMPSSVEVLHPSELKMTGPNLNNFLNDILARLHQYDMVLKNVHAQNTLMKKELEKLKEGKD